MSIRKNIFYNILLTSSNVLFPLITFPYITKTIGPKHYGDVNFVDAIMQYFLIFSTLGIPIYGIREVAKLKGNKQQLSKLVFELVLIQTVFTFFSIVILLFVSKTFDQLSQNEGLFKIGYCILILNLFVWDWLYQGLENYSYITARSLFSKICSIAFIFIFVKFPSDYIAYYLSFAIALAINSFFNLSYFFKNYYQRFNESLEIKKHIRPLFLILAINLSISIYTILDTILLGFLSDKLNVGYYSLSTRLVKIYWTMIGAVSIVLVPKISSLVNENKIDDVKVLMQKSLNVILFFTIPFAFFCLFFSNAIVVVISGTAYLQSAKSLMILSFLPLIIGVCNIFGTQFLVPMHKEKFILYATIAGLIFSLLINVLLIPKIAEEGAAIATLVAEFIVASIIFFAARRFIVISIDYSFVLQIVIISMLTVVLALFFNKYFNNLTSLLLDLGVYIILFIIGQVYLFKNIFLRELYLPFFKKIKK